MPCHNSIWGRHHYTTGATCTQTCTLVTVLVPYIQALHPTIRVYIDGQLNLMDYPATALTANRLQCSSATYTRIPSHQPTKYALTLVSTSNAELLAGAHSFLVSGHSWLLPCHYSYPTTAQPTNRKPATLTSNSNY